MDENETIHQLREHYNREIVALRTQFQRERELMMAAYMQSSGDYYAKAYRKMLLNMRMIYQPKVNGSIVRA